VKTNIHQTFLGQAKEKLKLRKTTSGILFYFLTTLVAALFLVYQPSVIAKT
jgi:hypothetical protein